MESIYDKNKPLLSAGAQKVRQDEKAICGRNILRLCGVPVDSVNSVRGHCPAIPEVFLIQYNEVNRFIFEKDSSYIKVHMMSIFFTNISFPIIIEETF